MKKIIVVLILALTILNINVVVANKTNGKINFKVEKQTKNSLEINLTIKDFSVNFNEPQSLQLAGSNILNNAGTPNLSGISRYIAIPEGATVSVESIKSETETYNSIEILPSKEILTENQSSHPSILKKSMLYNIDKDYPAEVIKISSPISIRGINVVKLTVVPFQYNPVKRKLNVYKNIKLKISFDGGSSYSNNIYRNRWWDPMLSNLILNYNELPEINYNRTSTKEDKDFEYIIICPNNPSFLKWADSLKHFRTLQGIRTGIVTLTQLGGNKINAIKNYIANAYNTWKVKPVGVLLIGDYGKEGSAGDSIVSPMIDMGDGGLFGSDNGYADINGNNLPDVVISRISIKTGEELKRVVKKILHYEKHPPMNKEYYDKPLLATRGSSPYLLFSEVIREFLAQKLNKHPRTEYVSHHGNKATMWGGPMIDYFGSKGLGYIKDDPTYITDYTGSTQGILDAINSGVFMALHRDHGMPFGWVHPSFRVSDMKNLTNNASTYVFSINCYTGEFFNTHTKSLDDCFAEAILKHEKGAVGVIAAITESYPEYNEIFGWGVIDYFWPNFMPDKNYATKLSTQMPAFANTAGKYYLSKMTSGNLLKYMIYNYHYFGDVFSTMYTEVPKQLTVTHSNTFNASSSSFTVTANDGALIALTVNGKIIGTGTTVSSSVNIPITSQFSGSKLTVTVTKPNYLRYEKTINISGTTSVNNELSTLDYKLNNNYPNPFNPTTVIKYQIPNNKNQINSNSQNSNFVSLKVYDVLGKEVATLVNKKQSPGNYKVQFNATNLPSGVYFYKLHSDSFTQTKKMLLAK